MPVKAAARQGEFCEVQPTMANGTGLLLACLKSCNTGDTGRASNTIFTWNGRKCGKILNTQTTVADFVAIIVNRLRTGMTDIHKVIRATVRGMKVSGWKHQCTDKTGFRIGKLDAINAGQADRPITIWYKWCGD